MRSTRRGQSLIVQSLVFLSAACALFLLLPEQTEEANTAVRASLASTVTVKSRFAVLRNSGNIAERGVTLVPVVGTEEILLLDANGHVKHLWPFDAVRARLLPNCSILVIHGTSSFGKNQPPWSELRNVVREYNWSGEVVWEYKSERIVHHDVHRLANGNTIFLERDERKLTSDSALNKARGQLLRYDIVTEVNPAGEVVYQWHGADHIDNSFCGWHGCESRLEENRFRENLHDWMHTNTLSILPQNKWYAAGDERFRPGNFLIMPRNFWTALLIDRESGKIVWRYRGSDDNPLIRGHEPLMIEEGLPGAGNILLFDNGVGRMRKHSIAREIDPISKKLVWSYQDPGTFFSKAAGRIQRLKNGNSLISEDRNGRVFEVTTKGDIVWELQVDGQETSRASRYGPGMCEKQIEGSLF